MKPYFCNVFARLKERIGLYLLQRESARVIRNRSMVDLSQARSICILCKPEQNADAETVSRWAKEIRAQNKEVMILGFLDNKEVTFSFTDTHDSLFFSPRECNWYGKPLPQEIRSATRKPFDLLIDLTNSGILPLLFIVGLSHARCRVGHYREIQYPCYDLLIKAASETSLASRINQVNHYLSVIHAV